MKRPYVLFVSNTTGFRVGTIMQGVLQACREANVGLLWRESDRLEQTSLRSPPIGVIIRDKLPNIQRVITRLAGSMPIVSTIGHTLEMPVYTVVPDPVTIARQVAAHLVEEGLRDFVFVGARNNPASRLRAQEFQAELQRILRRKVPFEFFDADLGERFWGADSELGQSFIRLLKKAKAPLGLLALNDQFAASCMECAEAAGVRVPHQLSIVGVDDHPIFTQMYQPLTSVKIDYQAIGRKAVALILQLQPGAKRADIPLRHYIGGPLIIRQSSRPRLLGDEHISKALQHLHDNYGKSVTLHELSRLVGMSRTSFATRFQRAVGQAPIRYLINLRLAQAKLLLKESTLTVSEVAYRVGFEDQGYFTRAFRKLCGTTPTDFRKKAP